MIAALEAHVRRAERSLTFGIGDAAVRVDSVLPEIVSDLVQLYGPARGLDPTSAVHLQITRSGGPPWRRGGYRICGDGRLLYQVRRRREVFPYLEWGINGCVRTRRIDQLQFHAAGLSRFGHGVLLAGESGSGKSTLAAALLARGWGYYCDELTFVDPDRLRLLPFPKALCIKSGSFEVVRGLGLPLAPGRCYVKKYKGRVGYLNPTAIAPDCIAEPSAVRYVLFPKYAGPVPPGVRRMSAAEAAFGLARNGLNKKHFGAQAIAMISAMVRGARCFELHSGLIGPTCDLLESLVTRCHRDAGTGKPG